MLADLLSSAFPGSGDKGARMLAELVRLGFLITSLRPRDDDDGRPGARHPGAARRRGA